MRRLGAVFVVMFTVLLVATGVGASASTSGVGAKVMAGDGQARRANVLIIGDSVFDAFDHVERVRANC